MKFDESAVRYHCQLLHHIAYRAGVAGKLILVGHGTAEDGVTKLPAVVHHFAIGSVDAMVAAAMAFDGTRYNVCTPWGIRPKDLARNKTGRTSEVLRLLALVTDSDADKGQSITPLTDPDYSVETSPGNFQHYFILDRALENSEAKQYAIAFQRMYPKAEFANDITHDWRVPGTFNITDKVKWDRGRPRCQPARIDKHWNSTFTDAGKLKAILHPHWEKPRPAPTVAHQKQYDNDPAKIEALFMRLRDASYFAAGPEARKRYVRAAKALSYDLGDEIGRDIWERMVCWQGGARRRGHVCKRERNGRAVERLFEPATGYRAGHARLD